MVHKIKSLFKYLNETEVRQKVPPLYQMNRDAVIPDTKKDVGSLDTDDISVSVLYFHSQEDSVIDYLKYQKNDYRIFLNDMQKIIESTNKYNKSDPTPVLLTFESVDSNPNPQYLYKQKSNIPEYDGVMKLSGSSNILGITVQELGVHVDMASPYALVHEFGHVIDNMDAPHNQVYASQDFNSDFANVYNIVVTNMNRLYPITETDFTLDFYNYQIDAREIYARSFNIWYDKEVFQHHKDVRNPTLFNIHNETFGKPTRLIREVHPVESTLYKIYDDYPEIQEYYTKRFGHIIPPENTKLYQKQNTITDQQLLNRLNNSLNNISKTSFDRDFDY